MSVHPGIQQCAVPARWPRYQKNASPSLGAIKLTNEKERPFSKDKKNQSKNFQRKKHLKRSRWFN
jgi:hypothetical protein